MKKTGNGVGWGGPAKGAGWGGPAKGAAKHPSRGHSGRIAARQAAQGARSEALCRVYYEIAHDPRSRTAVRLAAATHLLNRIEGKPITATITSATDDLAQLSDEELQADLTRVQAALRAMG